MTDPSTPAPATSTTTAAFTTVLPVRFGDVDPAGIVYYPRFLHYCHVAMEEYFTQVLGRPYPTVIAEESFGLPTVQLESRFHYPLRYGDEVEIRVAIESIGRSSVVWQFTLFKRGVEDPSAEARVVTVGVDMKTFEKKAVPEWFRARSRVDRKS